MYTNLHSKSFIQCNSFYKLYEYFLPKVLTLAGLFSGLTEAVIINPFEVVKVKLQAERDDIRKVNNL